MRPKLLILVLTTFSSPLSLVRAQSNDTAKTPRLLPRHAGVDPADSLTPRLARLKAALPALEQLLARCDARHIPTDYERLEYRVLRDALPVALRYVKTDNVGRGPYIVNVLDSLYQHDTTRLGAYLRGEVHPLRVGHYVAQRLRTDGVTYRGKLRDTGAVEHDSPLFFVRYGGGGTGSTIPMLVSPSDVLFQAGTPDWIFASSGYPVAKAQFRIDTTVAHSGRASVRVSNASPYESATLKEMFFPYAVAPHTTYRVTVWVRARRVTHTLLYTNSGYAAGIPIPDGTYDWRSLTFSFTTGSEQTRVFGVMTCGITDRLWIDDIRVTRAGDSKNLIPDAGFEQVAARQTRADFYASSKLLRTRLAPFLAQARRENKGVDLGLIPEDFPGWVYPPGTPVFGRERRLPFELFDPKEQAMISSYLETVLSLFGRSPALRRVTLMPFWQHRPTNDTAKLLAWHAYLRNVYHGRLYRLNAMHHTAYSDFSQVLGMDSVIHSWPAYYDWVRFDNDRFSRWQQWMADRIRRAAPDALVYIQSLPGEIVHFSPTTLDGRAGIGANVYMELAPGFSRDDRSPNQYYWTVRTILDHLRVYDLVNAFRSGPVVAVHKYVVTGDDLVMEAPYLRTAIWQGAIHGVGEAVVSIEDRVGSGVSSVDMGAAARPDLTAVLGETGLDLLRLGREVAAIHGARPDVAILYADPSAFYAGPYLHTTARAYDALAFSGHPGAFVTEAQVETGTLRRYKMLVIPEATIVHQRTLRAVARFLGARGRVVVIGKYSLHRNEYNLPLPGDEIRTILSKSAVVDLSVPDSVLQRVLAAEAESAAPADIEVVGARTGQPVDSVEWRSVRAGRRHLINLVNYGSQRSVSFRVRTGATVCAKDLIRGGTCLPGPYLLRSFTPLLFEIQSAPRRP